MRRWRRNSRAPCTRLRSGRRRRARPAEVSGLDLNRRPALGKQLLRLRRQPLDRSKSGPGPLWFSLLDLGFAGRHDPQRGDAVALAAQDAEAEAVEGETLAAFRDRAGLVDHETGDR